MSDFELGVWVSREFPNGWTHVIKGSFAKPLFDTQAATDLFCYNRDTGIGAFFVTIVNGRLDDGTPAPNGPRLFRGNNAVRLRSNQIVNIPDEAGETPGLFLLYDAASGVGEFCEMGERGDLELKKHHDGWRTSWTQIIAGRFGQARLLFYDASNGVGEFYSVNGSGEIGLVRSHTDWRHSWHSIITGNFSSSSNDDLLFYDRSAGVGEFYAVNSDASITQIRLHDNWRNTWQHIVSGDFFHKFNQQTFDGLLFYEERSSQTEFYSTDGHGNISMQDVNPGDQWFRQWDFILSGKFAPSSGLVGASSLCAYHADGLIRYFFIDRSRTSTIINLDGNWTAGGPQHAVITVAFNSLNVRMSAFNRPDAHGSILDSSTITVTFPDDKTYTGTLQPPDTIRWSNGSTWRKTP